MPHTKSHPAKVRTSRAIASTVWLIPLIAALTGGYLLVKNIRDKGPEITLFMDDAAGIEVNTTAIKVLNVDVGRVSKIRLRPDQKGVEITAKLNKDVADYMRKDTQFWVVKPRIDRNGITGLDTLVSGSYIAFTPGKSTEEANEFKVSDLPPTSAIGQSGLRLYLEGSNNKKMLEVGSPVIYEHHTVGSIESAKFDAKNRSVNYTIFIQSPNDILLSSNSEFWIDSGIDIRTNGTGVSVQTPPLSALFSGAIAFDTPKRGSETATSVKNGQSFKVYNNREEVDQLPGARTLYYTVFFDKSIRGLSAGAPVEYKGIQIGSVADAPYFAKDDSLKLLKTGLIPVRIRIDPYRLEINAGTQSQEYWQSSFQAALNRGLSATLTSNNLILGSKMIELDDGDKTTALRPYAQYAGYTVIGSHNSGLDDLQAQVSKLLDKFNKLPLDQTVGELNANLRELRQTLKTAQGTLGSVNTTLGSANKLLSNSGTQNLPVELNKTLTELRQTLQGISPQSPVYQDVQQTLKSLDRTLSDAQPLIQTLRNQPNALIFNSQAQDPTPKGHR